jgi:hypothetical protein
VGPVLAHATAAAQTLPLCAACVVLALAPGDTETAVDRELPVAVVMPADAPQDAEAVTAALSLIPPFRATAIILDARANADLTDRVRYQLPTMATAARAARDISVGVRLFRRTSRTV